jgi:hypothetical protein
VRVERKIRSGPLYKNLQLPEGLAIHRTSPDEHAVTMSTARTKTFLIQSFPVRLDCSQEIHNALKRGIVERDLIFGLLLPDIAQRNLRVLFACRCKYALDFHLGLLG